ncbi:hypothetical protein A2U01_0086973, partial [Trifolium medium]|nr:hypothetical protein [Trifolium medium]
MTPVSNEQVTFILLDFYLHQLEISTKRKMAANYWTSTCTNWRAPSVS